MAIFKKCTLVLAALCMFSCVTVSSTLQVKEEKLFHAGQFEETVRYLEGAEGTLYPPTRQKIVKENLKLVQTGKNTTIEYMRYLFNIKQYAAALIETGQIDKALTTCDQGIVECNTMYEFRAKMLPTQERVLTTTLMYLTLYKGYITWFKTGNAAESIVYFNESIKIGESLIEKPKELSNDPFRAIVEAALMPLDMLINSSNPGTRADAFFLIDRGSFEYKMIGNYPKAFEYFNKALQLAQTLNLTDLDSKYAISLEALRKMALVNMYLGKLDEAEKNLDQYESITNETAFKLGKTAVGGTEHFRGYLCLADSTAGALYAVQRDFERSKQFFDRAVKTIEIIEKQPDSMWDKKAVATFYVYYGTYFLGLQHRYTEAAQYIDKGLTYLSPYYIESIDDDLDIESAYVFSAEVSYMLGDYNKAVIQAKKAAEYASRYHNSLTMARAATLMGQVYFKQGEVLMAKQEFEKAISLNKGNENTENWKLYYGLGQVYESMGEQNKALPYYKQSVDEVEKLWEGRFMDTRKQISFIDKRLVAFEPVIRILASQQNAKEAIHYMERAKARTFFDNVLFTPEQDAAGKSASIVDTEPLTGEKIRDMIDSGTAVLEYYVGESAVIGAAITKKEMTVKVIPVNARELASDVMSFRASIFNSEASVSTKGKSKGLRSVQGIAMTDTGQSHATLYERLIKPFEKNIAGQNLVYIVPHGVLHYVPFQALQEGSSPKSGRPRYFIEKYEVAYTPSMTILSAIQMSYQKFNGGSGSSLLAIASPPRGELRSVHLGNINLEKLESAKGEAFSVAELYTNKTVYTDEQATETAAKDNAPKYETILFSTHACLIPQAPLKSFVLFDADKTNDGQLTVEEIEAMKLNADMVVLSACETGLVAGIEGVSSDPLDAQFPLGDDLVGLQRAFMKSGSASVVSTLWEVDDESTSQLIKIYFKHYREGKTKSSALRESQLSLLRSKQWSDPFYWAPFILSGKWK